MKLPNKEALEHALWIDKTIQAVRDKEAEIKFLPQEFQDQDTLDNWCEVEKDDSENGNSEPVECEIWIHSQYGAINSAAVFIQYLLNKFDPEGCVYFQWSNDCSKPRLDAYGGGAVFITAKDAKFMSTGEWVDRQFTA